MTTSCIIIRSGRTGETRFASQSQQIDKSLRKKAIDFLLRADVVEWYRQHYNIKIDSEEFANLNEEVAIEDFYRRQFYAELRFGVRKWTNRSTEFLMPPFTLLKQFGGVLPAPNGYGFSNDDTVDNKKLLRNAKKNAAKIEDDEDEDDDEEEEDEDELQEEEFVTKKTKSFIKKASHTNPNIPPHIGQNIEKPTGGMVRSENLEVEMPEEDFWKWVEAEEEKTKKLFEEELRARQNDPGGSE